METEGSGEVGVNGSAIDAVPEAPVSPPPRVSIRSKNRAEASSESGSDRFKSRNGREVGENRRE